MLKFENVTYDIVFIIGWFGRY